MLYFDTSFLVPLLLPEPASRAVDEFFNKVEPTAALTVSQWGRVEFASVLSRLSRMGELTKAATSACAERFDKLIGDSFDVIAPTVADYDLCWGWLCRFDSNLRAGDALHLAIAANAGATKVYTLDHGMLEAGRQLGLPMSRGIPD